MENESRFCVRFHCGFRSIQATVVIESFYRTHVNLFFNLHETAPTEWDLALQIRLIGISFLAFHYFTT